MLFVLLFLLIVIAKLLFCVFNRWIIARWMGIRVGRRHSNNAVWEGFQWDFHRKKSYASKYLQFVRRGKKLLSRSFCAHHSRHRISYGNAFNLASAFGIQSRSYCVPLLYCIIHSIRFLCIGMAYTSNYMRIQFKTQQNEQNIHMNKYIYSKFLVNIISSASAPANRLNNFQGICYFVALNSRHAKYSMRYEFNIAFQICHILWPRPWQTICYWPIFAFC